MDESQIPAVIIEDEKNSQALLKESNNIVGNWKS